jgi:flagellar motility protein MotE (MotC chaperone)
MIINRDVNLDVNVCHISQVETMSSSSKYKASQFDEVDRGITKVEKNLSLQRGTSNKLKGKKRVEDVEKLEKLKNEESKIENELKKLKEKKKKFLDGGS